MMKDQEYAGPNEKKLITQLDDMLTKVCQEINAAERHGKTQMAEWLQILSNDIREAKILARRANNETIEVIKTLGP